ncbi:MAG: TIR domain-containing protein [Pyrinomonadaceae bacterium]|nr:TIR domain-containing protein [Pyrinomonadaceae bacterium]
MSSSPPPKNEPSEAEFKIDAFMSYARNDLDFVRRLRQALEDNGKRVLLNSLKGILSDSPSTLQGADDIERANSFIFVLSPDSLASPHCRQERLLARGLGKPIFVPVITPGLRMPEEFGSAHMIDFSDEARFDEALRELVLALDGASTQQPQPYTGPEPYAAPPAPQPAGDAVRISMHSPSSTTTTDLLATPALAHLLAKATRINQAFEKEFDLSFSSMLLAFLTADDPLSRWFGRYVKDSGIAIDELLRTRKLERATLEEIAAQPLSETELSRLTVARRWTASSEKLFEAAMILSIGDAPQSDNPPPALFDVRHLMSAYIYQPSGHEKDLEGLRFNRAAWSHAFLGQMQKMYPQELERWKEIHRQTFSTEPIPIEEMEGPSTHIASDMWTLNDTLGYRAYAHAIYRFMTHKQTRPPLTISIQAPWGGGKTSLMRMIQHALDPEALGELKSEEKQPRGKLSIRGVLDEITKWTEPEPVPQPVENEKPLAIEIPEKEKRNAPHEVSAEKKREDQEALPKIPADEKRKLLTIWFNAWKYESVNQVWSGLVDSIMQQVAARLPLLERELFWLRLNLKRVDADKLRQRIHERIFRYWWRAMRYWVIGMGGVALVSLLIALGGWVIVSANMRLIGLSGTGLSILGSIFMAAWKYLRATKEVKEEPAAVSLSEYLDIPNYNAEMGFIHRVEADLRRVLASVPQQYYPIVIFVDDLDRCSPAKVGQVVEAVNLFLAGDFPNCMFVMGMDTEMVAAALQAAHKDMISQLPSDAGIPVGWRFMDKFVQLPFMIPPTEKGNLLRYTTSLFSNNLGHAPDAQVDKLAQEAAARIVTRAAVEPETEKLREEHHLNEAQVARMKDQMEARVVQRKLDEGIEKFNDQNPEIKRVIAAATSYFRGNPRELKRFINAFRFQYFLWWAQRAQGLDVPTLDQLRRWTVLSMRWPEVVRWLRRSGGSEWRASAEANLKDDEEAKLPTRLKLLEDISSEATDLESWHKRALTDLRIKPETTSWLNDDDLLQFFYEECAKYSVGQRLSDGLGRGLW